MSRAVTSHLWSNLLDKITMPLQHALFVPQLYASTLLLSADIFSYVMCLTVLPGLAVSHHSLKNAEIPFLFSLLAFPWMCFSLMTPRFGSSLYKHKLQWYTMGSICKCLALICKHFKFSTVCSVSSSLTHFTPSYQLLHIKAAAERIGCVVGLWSGGDFIPTGNGFPIGHDACQLDGHKTARALHQWPVDTRLGRPCPLGRCELFVSGDGRFSWRSIWRHNIAVEFFILLLSEQGLIFVCRFSY